MSDERFEDLSDDFVDPITQLTREDILAERYTISPTHDTPFKFLFGQEGESEPLLMSLLNELLDLQGEERIIELKYTHTEVTPSVLDGRRFLLDLRVTDQSGKTTTWRFSERTAPRSSSAPSFSSAGSAVSN